MVVALSDRPVAPPLRFAVTDTELSDYYERLAAQADPSADPSAPWDTWMLLMAPGRPMICSDPGALVRL